MAGLNLPYLPIRQQLYSSNELFKGFDPLRSSSWGETADFEIYRHFVTEGRSTPRNPYTGMMQALHDTTITQSTQGLLTNRKVTAIMGGHKLTRRSRQYKDVARLSRRLSKSGMLVCTGGGPGAMEAAHLGAAFSPAKDSEFDNALAVLERGENVPELGDIVDGKGRVSEKLVEEAHEWFLPAFRLSQSLANPGESLAIPTWHYGHEPTTPFATHIAKYFQNSIREEGLLALANQGVIYAEGKAGTLQEIFQDSAQNYYKTFSHFSPMVMLGAEYWTKTYPVVAVLKNLFGQADFERYVLVTDSIEAAVEFIEKFSPV